MHFYKVGTFLLLVMPLGLTGCGGGGGGGGGDGSGTASQLNYSLSQTSVTAQATTADSSIQSATISFTVNNFKSRPAGVFTTAKVSWTGTAIENVSATFLGDTNSDNTANGSITISFWRGALLGAGVYPGTVTFTLCFDATTATCDHLLAGGPSTISATLSVTGDAKPITTASLSPSALALEAPTGSSQGPNRLIFLTLSQTASPGPFVTFSQPANGFVSGVSYTATGSDNGSISVSYVAPGKLAVGVHSESLVVNICVDSLCQHPLQNSPITVPLTYTITGAVGLDYNVQTVGIVANDIAWIPSRQRIYAAVSGQSSLDPSSLVEIGPQTASITRTLPLAGEPVVISASDDGSYVYVGFADQGVVQRVALGNLTADITISLGSDPTNGPYYAGFLAAEPGAPRSIAVANYSNPPMGSGGSQGVTIYDDAVARPMVFGATGHGQQANSLAWGSSSSTLYAYEPFMFDLFTVAVSPSGLSQSGEIDGIPLDFQIQFNAGLIYADNGVIVDPSSGAIKGNFLTTGTFFQPVFTLDSTLNRAYFFFEDDVSPVPLWTLASFDLTQHSQVSKTRTSGMSLTIGPINRIHNRLIRWGSDGLAINAQEGLKILSGSLVTL